MAATPANVELQAAKFLHKLIQDSKDEPTKLATKLYVILQHMRSNGKENSMPYQVISRAMETVINQHRLDIESLMSSRLPLASGTQVVDSSASQVAGSSQRAVVEKDSKENFAADESAKIGTYSSRPPVGPSSSGHDIYQGSVSHLNGASNNIHGGNLGASGSYALIEQGIPVQMQASSSCDNHGVGPKMVNDRRVEAFLTPISSEHSSSKGKTGNIVDQEGGYHNTTAVANKTIQGGMSNIVLESTVLRNDGSRDLQAPTATSMPFKEHHLKQLRAQCFVFLAFRNGLMPKKLHLDIALGNSFPKEDGSSKDLMDQKRKEQSFDVPNGIPEVTNPFGRLVNAREADRTGPGSSATVLLSEANLVKEVEERSRIGEKNDTSSGADCQGEERRDLPMARKPDTEMQSLEVNELHVSSNLLEKGGADQEKEDTLESTHLPPSPKYTTSEKWIMDRQKRKNVIDQNWAVKQQKLEQQITASSEKLKEKVSSSEDIYVKNRSVIELKKLQLLELQHRLRNDILKDFFRPIATEMDCLKSIKKNRIGRRSKHIGKYEQKMKEERQKRIRERQKEFFSEIEIHKERLEDIFKWRRERVKGFNKYAREFHKRKERLHREKIDRIQREKINLLKINDVEGYLQMVQDAKSDRVKQLLKETEKYLQKLGSKLKEAKAMSRSFASDIYENRISGLNENNEFTLENDDETDQAKHYLESNKKYYMMAHSIKETVAEQPTCLVGGILREYQLNGLRWLVSLYNNHLNGILADEMGLGKTIQVISLICYLMETKNDRGPFLVVVPSSVLPGWESEINFWAPSINKIVYSGPPEERRRLFKERIVQQKFNVLLTTYEYLMNKHDRPKLSKVQWHYVIIDEGHRIKNASCKLNADLKHYRSSHRLLLTGTPLQNNLEELWALLNFLLPNIFNSADDFSQWFNKPFESNGDNSPEQALLSEEENLLIINRLHQVLRPFLLRRLKHKVENELPEKIERLVRCEASSYQKLLMKRVEENLGGFGNSKARSVHNSVMELRNICNHPYLSQLHVEEVHDFIPKHYLPNVVRLCGKLEMLDRLLPKLKATDHRVLLFSTMTRLLDVLEDYLYWKQYRYLRLDGHTSGGDRGGLIDQFNQPGSPFFIFLLSIRAGGVGVNLQAADTVIIFDTDWNPQVDLQAQARAHRIGQKKDVLVLRLETVQTVEEQIRASAEHKLGVANQSITAGFFDNNTSAEDRREYLESLLRECKKEEAAPVLNDDALNDLIARSESEIGIFEAVDKKRKEEETVEWERLVLENGVGGSESIPVPPSRLLTDDDLKTFCEAMKVSEVRNPVDESAIGVKRKGESLGSNDMHQYGRGKRAREVRSYEEQWTEDEFEKLCEVDLPDSPKLKEDLKENNLPMAVNESRMVAEAETMTQLTQSVHPPQPSAELPPDLSKEMNPPSRRGRGRPRRKIVEASLSPMVLPYPSPSPPMTQVTQSVHPPQPSAELPPDQSKEMNPPSRRGRGRPRRKIVEASLSPMVLPYPSPSPPPLVSSSAGIVSATMQQSSTVVAPSSESTDKLPSGSKSIITHSSSSHLAPNAPPGHHAIPPSRSNSTPIPFPGCQPSEET